MELIIVGMGPGDYKKLTIEAYDMLRSGSYLLLRTAKHDVASHLDSIGVAYDTLDSLYDSHEDFDVLLESVTGLISEAIKEHQKVIYAVPGGAGLFDLTLKSAWSAAASCGASVSVIPGVGAAEEAAALFGGIESALAMPASAWQSLEPDPHHGLIISEIDSMLIASDVKIRLLDIYPPDCRVMYLFGGQAEWITLEQLDRQQQYNHTCSIVIPPVGLDELKRFNPRHLKDVMDILLGDNGCPWDKEQTHESLMPYIVEEAYEVVDAIRNGDIDHLYDELGDALLQVYFHAALAVRRSEFGLNDISTAVVSKMISRHTHIFGTDKAETAEAVIDNWEAIKKTEKGLDTLSQVMKDIPQSFPPLLRAYKVLQKAKAAGGEWKDTEVLINRFVTCAQRLLSVQSGDAELLAGMMFMYCVMLVRACSIRPDMALERVVNLFIRRVEDIETANGALLPHDWDTFLDDAVFR